MSILKSRFEALFVQHVILSTQCVHINELTYLQVCSKVQLYTVLIEYYDQYQCCENALFKNSSCGKHNTKVCLYKQHFWRCTLNYGSPTHSRSYLRYKIGPVAPLRYYNFLLFVFLCGCARKIPFPAHFPPSQITKNGEALQVANCRPLRFDLSLCAKIS